MDGKVFFLRVFEQCFVSQACRNSFARNSQTRNGILMSGVKLGASRPISDRKQPAVYEGHTPPPDGGFQRLTGSSDTRLPDPRCFAVQRAGIAVSARRGSNFATVLPRRRMQRGSVVTFYRHRLPIIGVCSLSRGWRRSSLLLLCIRV